MCKNESNSNDQLDGRGLWCSYWSLAGYRTWCYTRFGGQCSLPTRCCKNATWKPRPIVYQIRLFEYEKGSFAPCGYPSQLSNAWQLGLKTQIPHQLSQQTLCWSFPLLENQVLDDLATLLIYVSQRHVYFFIFVRLTKLTVSIIERVAERTDQSICSFIDRLRQIKQLKSHRPVVLNLNSIKPQGFIESVSGVGKGSRILRLLSSVPFLLGHHWLMTY